MHAGRDGDPRPLSGAPDVPVAVAGWRCWRVGASGTDLVSPIVRAAWPPGRPSVAVCDVDEDHAAPDPECSCGLYAMREPPVDYAYDTHLLGCVVFWGRIVEGERGYRAERGYPVVLFASPAITEKQCRRIAERYAVPVHQLPLDPGELLDHAHTLNEPADRVRIAAAASDRDALADAAAALLAAARAAAPAVRERRRFSAVRRAAPIAPRRRPVWRRLWAVAAEVLITVVLFAMPVALGFGVAAGLDAVVPDTVSLFPVRQADGAAPGTCIATEQDWDERTVTTADSCAEEHWGEVLGYRPLGPAPSAYPGHDQVAATGSYECRWLLAARGLPESEYRVGTALPPEASWNRGNGEYENHTTCVVTSSSGRPLPAGRLVDPERPLDDVVAVPTGLFTSSLGANAPTGACVGPGQGAFGADPVPVVRCDRPHRAEVLGYPTLSPPGTPWPGDDAVSAAAVTACDRLSAAHRPPDGFATTLIWPARTWFDDPDEPHYTTCLLVRADGGTWTGPSR